MNFYDVAATALSYSLQSGFLLIVGLLAPRVLRLQHPKSLLVYWRALLAVVLLLPIVLMVWQPRTTLPTLAINGVAVEEVVATTLPSEMTGLSWNLIFLPVLVITILALARLAVGLFYLNRCRRTATPLVPYPESVAALQRRFGLNVPFAVTDQLSVPITFGWARPIVLVPPSFHQLSADQQEGVACHELLHVQRKDWPVTLFEELVRAMLWFHPAVWILIPKIAVSREQVVDAGTVKVTGKRRQYLDALWQIVCTCQKQAVVPALPLVGKSHLRARVERLKKEIEMSKTRILASTVVLGAVLMAAGVVGAAVFSSVVDLEADSPKQTRSWSTEDEKPPAENKIDESEYEELKTRDADEICDSITHTVVIEKVNPKYPEEARKEKIMGLVTVETVINEDGTVGDLRVLDSAHELLSAAAVEAVEQWKFEPALCDGKPVGVYYNLTVAFRLK